MNYWPNQASSCTSVRSRWVILISDHFKWLGGAEWNTHKGWVMPKSPIHSGTDQIRQWNVKIRLYTCQIKVTFTSAAAKNKLHFHIYDHNHGDEAVVQYECYFLRPSLGPATNDLCGCWRDTRARGRLLARRLPAVTPKTASLAYGKYRRSAPGLLITWYLITTLPLGLTAAVAQRWSIGVIYSFTCALLPLNVWEEETVII